MSAPGTSQNAEKLAFIRRKAYLIGDLGGVDYRHRGTLALTDIRLLGSANPDKPLLQRLTTPFGKAVGGTMLAATMLATPAAAKDAPSAPSVASQTVAFSPLPKRETPDCASLYRNAVGREIDASFSAHDYSERNPGKIGISIFPGQDLGRNTPEEVGTFLVNTFRMAGVEAECFVHNEVGPNGTGIDFKINGLSQAAAENRRVPFNLIEVRDRDRLRSVVAEAKMGVLLLADTGTTTPRFNP